MAQVDRRKLHPEFRKRLEVLISLVQGAGLRMRMTQGLRTPAEQNALYAQGRTTAGPRVTKARAGQGPHCPSRDGTGPGLAVDWCFTSGHPYVGHDAEWARFRQFVAQAGLVSGTSWGDGDHVEMPEWRRYR